MANVRFAYAYFYFYYFTSDSNVAFADGEKR